MISFLFEMIQIIQTWTEKMLLTLLKQVKHPGDDL